MSQNIFPITVPLTVSSSDVTIPLTVDDNAEALSLRQTADIRPMPEITIGEVETLDTGEAAYANMTGDSVHPVLNLGLPRGATGAQGPQGESGPAGQTGATGPAGADGFSPTATVSKSGDTTTITITDKDGTTTATVEDGTKLFVATYGTTTYAEVLAAYNAGNQIVAKNGSSYYALVTYYVSEDDAYFDFARISITASNRVRLKENGWTTDSANLVNQTRRINDKPLTSNITLTASDVGAQPSGDYAAAANGDTTNSAIRAAAIPYGECDSTSTSTAFTATVPGITEYRNGTCVMLKNGVVTSAANFTININGLGGKPSYSNMATGNDTTPTAPTRDTTIFNINYTMLFVYSEDLVEGGAWIGYRGYNSDTNTISYQVRTNSTQLPTVSRTRYYRLLFTNATNDKWVPANTEYDNSATSKKTVNQNAINPFGRIAYLGNSTNYAANANVSATAVWDQYAHALGYSFNRTGAALTLTAQKPVYVVCTPQNDGSAIMDSTTPIVQALPNTADGKIYIYLGIAYSATNIELVINHPVYHYYNGAIRLWTGPV